MSLRRTALARKTELRRTNPMPRGKRAQVSRARSTMAKQARDTGPNKATRDLILDRAQGCCELCGLQLHGVEWIQNHSVHHRLARGMGGSSIASLNYPPNLLLLCGDGVSGCHGLVESNRINALTRGWLVPFSGDPATVPVLVFGGVHVLLTHEGTYQEAT